MQRETSSISDSTTDNNHEIRRRVVKACQRCRLKKCKCDGANPCTRCKSDDAISYGKQKKSNKIIFPEGYVQMLERQHNQLIAGLQDLYRRIQTGEPWPAAPLELTSSGQPLTHKILEGLGVLHAEEWDEGVTQDGLPRWHSFEEQILQGSGIINDDDDGSSDASFPYTAATSPATGFPPIFQNSTIMAKEGAKHQKVRLPAGQTSGMPSTEPQPKPFETLPYGPLNELTEENHPHQDLPLEIPTAMPMFDGENEMQRFGMNDPFYAGDINIPYNHNDNDNTDNVDEWMSMPEGMLHLPSFQGLPR